MSLSAPPSAPDTPRATPPIPTRADGVELLGESRGSGYVEPTYLVRRPDGQVLQLSRLLYLTLERLDGRPLIDVASGVTGRVGRELTVEGVQFVAEHKLMPLGLVGTATAPPSQADTVLSLAGRRTLLRPPAVGRLARWMRPLFWPVVVVLVLEAVTVADYLTFTRHDVAGGVEQVLTHPSQLLLLLTLMVASMLFHEIGHAAGAHYGGARPGVIGMGLYIVWPAFYTDVTDAYRLGRAGRLRTDLGGIYFNLVFLLALLAAHEWTREPVLLAAGILTHLEIMQQLLPIVRLDGYFIVGDLVGVPDLFRWVRPILLGLLPGRAPEPAVRRLRAWVRWVVTGWVAVVVPVLAVNVGVLLVTAPHLLTTTASTMRVESARLSEQLHSWSLVPAAVTALSILALALPLLGLWVLATRTAGRIRTRLGSYADRGRRQRLTVLGGMTAAALTAAVTWLPSPAAEQMPPDAPTSRPNVTPGAAPTGPALDEPSAPAPWAPTAPVGAVGARGPADGDR